MPPVGSGKTNSRMLPAERPTERGLREAFLTNFSSCERYLYPSEIFHTILYEVTAVQVKIYILRVHA